MLGIYYLIREFLTYSGANEGVNSDNAVVIPERDPVASNPVSYFYVKIEKYFRECSFSEPDTLIAYAL